MPEVSETVMRVVCTGSTLVGHVDEPLAPESLQGGDEVEGDPGDHGQGEAGSVDDVPGAGVRVISFPFTGVEQIHIGVNQLELLLHTEC